MHKQATRHAIDVPFYDNTHGDGNQCYQLAMRSAIKHFLGKDVAIEELDRITGRGPDKWTWTSQLVPPLYDMGLKVKFYTKVDVTQLLGGERFIREHYGKDAEVMLQHTNMDVMINSVSVLMKYGIFERRALSEKEIETHIREGHLPLILLDWTKIKGVDAPFMGHMGVLTGFDDANFYFHHSGPGSPQPNMPILRKRLMAAWNAPGTDNDIVIVYGKR